VNIFDLITCFLYSIHYSYPISALVETLQRTWQALKPGGVFIFNAVDARGIRNDNGTTTQLRTDAAQLSFQSSWHYRGAGELLDLTLSITRQSSTGVERWSDHHTMTALTLPELQTMLEDIGFQVTMFEHDYAVMSNWDGASFNAILVACKPLVEEQESPNWPEV
jgi:SAM-dependent methyltransferase